MFLFKQSHRNLFLHGSHAALATWLLLFAAGSSAVGQQPVVTSRSPSLSAASEREPVELQHVVHVVGLEAVKPGASGDLIFDRAKLLFRAGETSASIAHRSILAFSIEHDDAALIKGTKGMIAGMAPYGVGQVFTAIRPSVDVLTLLYRDDFHAVHGSILILPKGEGDTVEAALAKVKLSPTEYPKSGRLGPEEMTPATAQEKRTEGEHVKPSVVVNLLTESVDGVPPEFPVAEYEELIAQLTDSGLFANVWRQGDVRKRPDALVLHVNVEAMKKGSARSRGLVPFTGATVIKSTITLVDASGQTAFQANVEGTKRMRGESLDATNSLAKKVRKELEKAPALKPGNPESNDRAKT